MGGQSSRAAREQPLTPSPTASVTSEAGVAAPVSAQVHQPAPLQLPTPVVSSSSAATMPARRRADGFEIMLATGSGFSVPVPPMRSPHLPAIDSDEELICRKAAVKQAKKYRKTMRRMERQKRKEGNWIAAEKLREALSEFLAETKQELHDEVVKAEESSESENEWKAQARRHRHNRDMIKDGFDLPEWSLEASLDEAEDPEYKRESESDGGSPDAHSEDTEDEDDHQDGGRRAGAELASDDKFLRTQLHPSFEGGTALFGKSAFAEAIVECQDLYNLDSDGVADDEDEERRDEHIVEHIEQVEEGVQEESDEFLAGDAYGPANGDTELQALLEGLSRKRSVIISKTAQKSAEPSAAEAQIAQPPEDSGEEDETDEKAEREGEVDAKQQEMEEDGATETEAEEDEFEESEEGEGSGSEEVDRPDFEEEAEPEELEELDGEPPQAQPTSPVAPIDDEAFDVSAFHQDMLQIQVESSGATPDYDAMPLPWQFGSKKRRRSSTVSESSLDQGTESQKRQRRAARAEKKARLRVPAPLFLPPAVEQTPSPSEPCSPPLAPADTTIGFGPATRHAVAAGGLPMLSNPLDLVPDGKMKQAFLSWFQAGYSLGKMQGKEEGRRESGAAIG